ncbi:MAG: hypothetical protein FWF54_08835 [Candidatus Azobacteroides sp.]|nr:hypothetical protein [Candidatus Azobacteroides sp.]
MRKFILLVLLLVTIGCSESKESNVIEVETFLNKLKSVPSVNVPKESLPEWIIVKINEIEVIHSKDISIVKIRIFKGEWNKQTVYFIIDSLNSCLLCEIYDEDGKKLAFSVNDSEVSGNFMTESQNWEKIYEFGEGVI